MNIKKNYYKLIKIYLSYLYNDINQIKHIYLLKILSINL